MKVMLNHLTQYAIDKLIIHSLEQALYQPAVEINGEEYVIWIDDHQLLQSRNLYQLREQLACIDVDIVLSHESPYDEMVGQPSKGQTNRMEVPLARMAPTQPKIIN